MDFCVALDTNSMHFYCCSKYNEIYFYVCSKAHTYINAMGTEQHKTQAICI